MNNKNNNRWAGLFLAISLCAGTLLHATDVLEHTINLRFEQAPLKAVLAEIARQGGFEWSYNAGILDENRRVTLIAEGWTVRETLIYLLGDAYTFKQNGEYLILKKQRRPQQRLSGYISDRRTGQKMANVTVYDRSTLRSTTTDANGFYELPVTNRSEIVVSKLSYRDTTLEVSSLTPRLVKLDLITDSLPHASRPSLREEVDRLSVRLEEFFVRSPQKISALNVRDSLHRFVQVSFLPGLGTNHRLSGSVINDWSFNVLAGYSRGNRVFEMAGLGNITRENVNGLQTAGLFNLNGGNTTGMQEAGLFNITGGDVSGLHTAGSFNIAGGNVSGMQTAGSFNIVGKNAAGMQSAGLFNYLKGTLRGVQFAGLYNFAGDTLRGAQCSGLANFARYGNKGAFQAGGLANILPQGQAAGQFAGIANYVHRIYGLQAAGILNIADSLRGFQAAGILNRAGYVRGVQCGLINYAREVHGVQLGLINLSKTGGYIALEISANDVLHANAAFKSGVPALYTILCAGADPDGASANRLWAYGAGIGSRLRLTRWSGVTFDLIHRHLSEGTYDDEIQEWAQLGASLEINLGKHLAIAGGPSANLFVFDPARTDATGIRERVVGRNWLDASSNADGWLSAWTGWTVAIRGRF